MKNYTKQDVLEMRELMKENYNRCMTMEVPANVDGVLYYVKNNKIIAYGCENEDDDTIMLTDLFDKIDSKLLSKARKVKNVVLHKDCLETVMFEDYYIDVNVDAEYAVDVVDKLNAVDYSAYSYKSKSIKSLKLRNACFIRRGALRNAIHLEKLDLGRVHTIEAEGLYNCSSLSNVDFSKVEFLGDRACSGCKALKFVDLSNLSEIKKDTFYGCESLEVVRLSSKCKNIEDGAFSKCENLKLIEYKGSQKEWYELSKNLKRWRTGLFVTYAYKNNRLRMKYIE